MASWLPALPLLVLALAPLGMAEAPFPALDARLAGSVPGVDSDGDGFADAAEFVLGSSPYDASDHPLDIGANALPNGGFELTGKPVSDATTCPVFGNTNVALPNPSTPLVIVSPCQASALNGATWTIWNANNHYSLRPGAVDVDGDLDRELYSPPAPQATGFYASYVSPQQAWSANFRALTFDIQSSPTTGLNVPPGAYVQIVVSLSPFRDPTIYLPFFWECALTWTGPMLMANSVVVSPPGRAPYRHVSVSPTQALFSSGWEGCADEHQAWHAAGANDASRRALLRGMRLVQTSFWTWNGAAVDNVDLRGSTLPG